jgi:hypothetical protein
MSLVIDLKGNLFSKIYNTFFLSNIEKKLFKHFYVKKDSIKNENVVLIQCVEDYFYLGIFSEFIKSLKKDSDIYVEQYVVRNLTLGATSSLAKLIKSILFNNRFRDNKWIRLYSSYCNEVGYRHEGSTNILTDINLFIKSYKIYKKIKSKDELLDLYIDDLKVGDLIYDSYLRFKPAPTVSINNIYLCIVIWQAMKNIKITKEYFKVNKPIILLTSYSTYIQHGIAVRIAVKLNTKVYSFGNYQTFFKKLTSTDIYHTSAYQNYKDNFLKLNDQNKKLEEAEFALVQKLNGTIDISTAYMKESAYVIKDEKIPNVKNHIIVFLHDFYDSPHIYGNMLFNDFLEWIEFTIVILEENNIPYFLKPHPNQIKDSNKVVSTLLKKYPNIKLLSTKITNRQLVDNHIIAGISVYGTVAHELVYMGIPIILCGDNPHSSYNFCYEAKTKNEYKNYIKNYLELTIPIDYKEQIESFYYMHNLNKSADEIISNNAISNLRKINTIKSDKELSYIKEQINLIFQNNVFNSFSTHSKKSI